MKMTIVVQMATALACSVTAIRADTITLRNGQAVQGVFLGGNARQVDVMTETGEKQSYPLTEIKNIAISSHAGNKDSGRSTSSSSRPSVVIPAGTPVQVRTIELIDVDTSKTGATFHASLDDPIMIGGAVVVPRGADVSLQAAKVQQSGRMKGSDLIQLKMNTITVRGAKYPVVSSVAEMKGGSEGKSTAKKAVGGAGLGAIIGGIAGGGKGAGIGALVGGAGGTAVAASGQQHLKIPAETRLEFKLQADVAIK